VFHGQFLLFSFGPVGQFLVNNQFNQTQKTIVPTQEDFRRVFLPNHKAPKAACKADFWGSWASRPRALVRVSVKIGGADSFSFFSLKSALARPEFFLCSF
jgi:hypothetical protein